MSEHGEQVALFDWVRLNESKHPQLKLLFAIPNGGLRNKMVAVKLKREGVKSGVPDMFLAVPRLYCGDDPEHGLFIEMKFAKNGVTKNQNAWIVNLQMEGYCVKICYSFEEAKQAIIDYLGIEKP